MMIVGLIVATVVGLTILAIILQIHYNRKRRMQHMKEAEKYSQQVDSDQPLHKFSLFPRCQLCGEKLVFIKPEQRYYCEVCQKYR